MISAHDTLLAMSFSERRNEARIHLRREMELLGLHESDGWQIVETIRQVQGGSELVLRPLHMHLPSPPGVECVIHIDTDGERLDSYCDP